MSNRDRPVVTGWVLLPPSPVPPYRGIDRRPFQPALLESEMDPLAQALGDLIWVFYPPGWRRDAYRLFEESSIVLEDDAGYLISSREAAVEIQHIIEPHAGPHEIIACAVWMPGVIPTYAAHVQPRTIGFDIAYPGGDYYSAVLNGLFINPDRGLQRTFKRSLNASGLFSSTLLISGYIDQFRKAVETEANSAFSVYWLAEGADSEIVVED